MALVDVIKDLKSSKTDFEQLDSLQMEETVLARFYIEKLPPSVSCQSIVSLVFV